MVELATVGLGQLLDGINRSDGRSGGTDDDDEGHDDQLNLADLLDAIELQVEDDGEDKSQHAVAEGSKE